MFRARADTEHFEFEAFGADKQEAIDLLIDGLRAHGREYNLQPDWFAPYLEDASVDELPFPCVQRDRQTLDIVEEGVRV